MIRLCAPPDILFGAGAAKAAGEAVARLGLGRVFVVTTPGMPRRPVYAALLGGLRAAGLKVEVWAKTPAEPGRGDLADAATAAAAWRPDGIAGLGGGSALDLAKLVSMLMACGGVVDDYLGVDKVPKPILPTILLPTTAGSGSEVSPDAVLTDRVVGTKYAVKDAHLISAVAVVDPESTLTCPPELTVVVGLDALCHALEAFIGRKANFLSDLYALEALHLIHNSLPVTIRRSGDLKARTALARGALLAGLAFSQTGTAAIHACGYPLSGRWGIPHGLANGVMMAPILAFNTPYVPPEKIARLRLVFGGEEKLAEGLRRFVGSLGIATRLRDLGIARESLAEMAAMATTDRRHLSVNPRPMAKADLEAVFEAAW